MEEGGRWEGQNVQQLKKVQHQEEEDEEEEEEWKYVRKFKTFLTVPPNLAANKVYKSLHWYVFIYIKGTES